MALRDVGAMDVGSGRTRTDEARSAPRARRDELLSSDGIIGIDILGLGSGSMINGGDLTGVWIG